MSFGLIAIVMKLPFTMKVCTFGFKKRGFGRITFWLSLVSVMLSEDERDGEVERGDNRGG